MGVTDTIQEVILVALQQFSFVYSVKIKDNKIRIEVYSISSYVLSQNH